MGMKKDCSNRASFDHPTDAARACSQAKKERAADLDFYHCRICGKWHLYNRKYADKPSEMDNFIHGCIKKSAYTSAYLAQEVADRVKKERGVELHCYYCPHCGKFHLTKNVQDDLRKVF